jgi:replicative DNA helicase
MDSTKQSGSNVVELGKRGGGFRSPEALVVGELESAAAMWARLSRIGPDRLLLGYPRFEEYTQPSAHKYVILAARPGMFKTTLAWSMALNLAMAGKAVLWLGVEMGPEQMALWSLSRLTGIPERRIVAFGRRQISISFSERTALKEAEERLASLPIVKWNQRRITLQQVKETSRRAPYDAVFLDYVGLVQAPGANIEERTGNVSKEIAIIARELPVYFVALVQMTRDIEHTPNGKPRLPQLSDLRGSGQLEADADVVAFLHRFETGPQAPKDEVQLRIEKSRDGPPGVWVDLKAKPLTREIEEFVPELMPEPTEEASGAQHWQEDREER